MPVGGKCTTLAAQVKYVAFYLDVLEKRVLSEQMYLNATVPIISIANISGWR